MSYVTNKYPEQVQLKNSKWKLNEKCLEDENDLGFTISPFSIKQNDISSRWGYFISFSDSTFTTHYSAPCGNDCFTSVSGTYHWLGNNQIEFFVKDISRSQYCNADSETPQKSFGTYILNVADEGVIFDRVWL